MDIPGAGAPAVRARVLGVPPRAPNGPAPAVVTVAAAPVVLGAVGFTGAGIAASSIAASMMSSAAIANGGGVAAGGLVATLQSVGECPRCGQGEASGQLGGGCQGVS